MENTSALRQYRIYSLKDKSFNPLGRTAWQLQAASTDGTVILDKLYEMADKTCMITAEIDGCLVSYNIYNVPDHVAVIKHYLDGTLITERLTAR